MINAMTMAKRLFFVQHAIALDKSEDVQRPISKLGIQQSEHISRQLHNNKIEISQIFHSGKLRARQTAEIFCKNLNVVTVSAVDYLSPNEDIALTMQQLNTNNALYIGHLPHLEKLVSRLVTGQTQPSIITFNNSATVCLEKTGNMFSIQWYITPALLA